LYFSRHWGPGGELLRDEEVETVFVKVKTLNTTLMLTPEHLLPAGIPKTLLPAGKLRTGDLVYDSWPFKIRNALNVIKGEGEEFQIL